MNATWSISKTFLLLGAILALMTMTTLTAGLILGFILNSLVPAIDFGIATLCGLCAIAIPSYVLIQAMLAFQASGLSEKFGEENNFDDEDLDVLSDAQVDALTEQLVEAMMQQISSFDTRPKRHAGRSR